jgi:SAM-dependent methyltransferase
VELIFTPRLEQIYSYIDRAALEFCRTTPLPDEPAPEARYLHQTIRDILAEECDGAPRSGTYAEAAPILELLERCRLHAPAFLEGRESGLSVIFPRGDLSVWELVHRQDAVMSIYADIIPPALAEFLPHGARILEVGAGVGAVLQRCRPLLKERGLAEYWFTDLGRLFVLRAPQEPWLRSAVLDLDQPLAAQNIPLGYFDAVIGVNVLHSAKDLQLTLRQLRCALRPGGRLLLGEGSPPARGRRWRLDLVFAFLRGWWDVPRRPGFLFPSEWLALLQLCGFENSTALPARIGFAAPAAAA